MADVFSPEKRSDVMSRIRSHGNRATELSLISVFRELGITGWRRRQPIFGKPDFVFRKLRLAVFVDGCFWHSCPDHATSPRNRSEFWEAKLTKNRNRDRLVTRKLKQDGWYVLRIWEHELKPRSKTNLVRRLRRALKRAENSPSPNSRRPRNFSDPNKRSPHPTP